MVGRVLGLVVAASVLATQVYAASVPAGAPVGVQNAEDRPTVLEGVVVHGQTRDQEEEMVRDFVGTLTVHEDTANGRAGQIQRFDRFVCAGVWNMPADYAQVINDRIGRAARMVGLGVGEPGCRANILIYVSSNMAALVPAIEQAYPDAFISAASRGRGQDGVLGRFDSSVGPASRGTGPDRGSSNERRADINELMTSGRPVQTWHTTFMSGLAGRSRLASHFSAANNVRVGRVIVLVDPSKMGEINLIALGDYIAMVALAPLELDEDLSEVPTILNLFNDRVTPPDELTPFDESYLAALYGAPSDVEWGSIQQSAMAASMLRDAQERRRAADAEVPAAE